MSYEPIDNYGAVGNMHTVALVSRNGSIDWFCYPKFDSPSVFGAILDDRKGGRFRIAPSRGSFRTKQFYWPDTNVLVTRFHSPDGVGEVTDYMPLGLETQQLVRRVSVARGSVVFRVECSPAFNYALSAHETTINETGAGFHSEGLSIGLRGPVPLERRENGVSAELTLTEGQTATFVLGQIDRGGDPSNLLDLVEAAEHLEKTVEYWHRWLSRCTYTGRWRGIVHRSALVLKLLTYEPTGAIVAAPTTSLPEEIGGTRNWDYRYTWIRDASFTLYALMRIGFTDEAARFMEFLDARTHEARADGTLQVMYGIDGQHELSESSLDHLEGYRGSRPVRVGNGAYNQLQLDIYGELMDAVYLYNKYGAPISYDLWNHLRKVVDWVCNNWRLTDEGIWEVRGGRQHFVYSKLMCWVAVDRGLRLADKRSFPADRNLWQATRDQIYEDIMTNGWSEKHQTYVQAYGSEHLDASNLMMPLVFFLSPNDPRMLNTIDSINRPLREGGLVTNGLVYRYDVERTADGLRGEEGTFSRCSFWLVEALTRAGKYDKARLSSARLMFEQMLGYANHLGLYSEEISSGGEALGNFPQAFAHLALISAAFNLDRALGGGV